MNATMVQLVDMSFEDPRWVAFGLEPLAETAARAVLAELGLNPDRFEISLLACDDARISLLNAEFRGKPAPTNVLSWPTAARGAAIDGTVPDLPQPASPMPEALGDIAIAWETCASEAAGQGKPMAHHVTHLIVHGTLHLIGYDHIRDGDALVMEGLEAKVLASLGVSDPYR